MLIYALLILSLIGGGCLIACGLFALTGEPGYDDDPPESRD